MRLTIDHPEEPVDYTNAVRAFMQVRAANPDQQIGNGGIISVDIEERPYHVVRNEESYTVRCGEINLEEDLTLEGIPI